MATRTSAKEAAPPGSILLVIHDFVARSSDELSLAKGDRIELIERDDEFGDGWFLGRHMGNNKTGLFPEVYTTPAPRGTLTNFQHSRRGSDGPPKTPQVEEGTNSTSPRHFSASAVSARPTTASSNHSTSSSAMQQTALRTSLPSATSLPRDDVLNTSSPVMHETLSVIDEHMNDMNAPSPSFTNGNARDTITEENLYPTKPLSRLSYIAGHETDEEEQQVHTEEEVMAWAPERVAEYLEDQGVEKKHCEIFKEQEISGEVLLAMEQSSLFLKEFELGSVGRRLKTWHKVRALQDEVRQSKIPDVARSTSSQAGMDEETGRNRASTMGSVLPRALDTSRQSMSSPGRSNTVQSMSSHGAPSPTSARPGAISPLQSMTSMSRAENTYRPSAQIIREMQHSRRHSSIDSNANSVHSATRQSHRKQPSFDRSWQPGQPQTNGPSANHSHTLSAESAFAKRDSSLLTPTSPGELDRGYFSSNELDTISKARKTSKRLSATGTPIISRPTSYVQNRRSTHSGNLADIDPLRDPVSPTVTQGIFGALNSVGNTFGSVRSATAPTTRRKPVNTTLNTTSPVVTKLEYGDQSRNTISASPNAIASADATSPNTNKMPFFASQKSKLVGLRTISDAITRSEKTTVPSPVKDGDYGSPARTGSTTPSTETRSLEMAKAEALSRTSGGSATNLLPPPTSQRRMKPKTKKSTSAYTRGLEKKAPAEQMIGCDYSGWMKKKSGSLMTTWKTRLFVLRGRRLSYYYSDGDVEEKGLIDISFHRVLPAQNEMLTGLHATVTGAGSPASPKDNTTPTTAEQDLKEHPPAVGENNDGIFIFKLVPPKAGLSKAVTFTKPTVHYFAVNSRQEGRLWMAALMKATIDRDEDGMVTTTYNQKTISLAKARARRERPPALRESDGEERAELEADDDNSSRGLGIGGLSEKEATVAGADKDLDGSSFAPSTAATSSEMLNEKEGASN